ncbi:hypothetical protein CLORY_32040 [Clostridium oryzae]|uniref:Uncharacterized protein n=1 Tax=Clostridium oryzae TaxID=1450648 RepID=A0A1V4III5_9CLOT|nr:hypothetical protein CLORY_32040 [Clostridium oryzae]
MNYIDGFRDIFKSIGLFPSILIIGGYAFCLVLMLLILYYIFYNIIK